MDAPDVRFAKSGDVNIAYATAGEGPFDLVFVNGWVLSALGYAWEGPAADFFRALASFSRLILFDKRGTGLSDRATGIPDLETRMDDIRAVMDAAGSKRAAVMGFSEGGPMTLLFAGSYPERTAAAVLYGCRASYIPAGDYPWGFTRRLELVTREDRKVDERRRSMAGETQAVVGTSAEEARTESERERETRRTNALCLTGIGRRIGYASVANNERCARTQAPGRVRPLAKEKPEVVNALGGHVESGEVQSLLLGRRHARLMRSLKGNLLGLERSARRLGSILGSTFSDADPPQRCAGSSAAGGCRQSEKASSRDFTSGHEQGNGEHSRDQS